MLALVIELARQASQQLLVNAGTGYVGTTTVHDGTNYEAKGNEKKTIHSLFGEVQVTHFRYVPEAGSTTKLRTYYPLDERLGIEQGHTPACEYFLTTFTGNDVYEEGVARFNEIFRAGGAGLISHRKAIDVTNKLGQRLEESQQKDIGTMLSGGTLAQHEPIEQMAVFMDATKAAEVTTEVSENAEKTRVVQYRDAKLASVARYEWDAKTEKAKLKDITHVAAVETADLFEDRAIAEMIRRGKTSRESLVVFIADGASWIWDRVPDMADNRVEILDFYHATEHLSNIAKRLHGEGTAEYKKTYDEWVEKLYQGNIRLVLHELELTSKKQRGETKKMLKTEIAYFNTHRERMRYDIYRMKHYPIGSGTVESGCKNVVGCRMKRTGMKWSPIGMTSMLQIRASIKSKRFKKDFERVVLQEAA